MTRDDEAFLYETGIEPGSDLALIESQLFSMQAEYIESSIWPKMTLNLQDH